MISTRWLLAAIAAIFALMPAAAQTPHGDDQIRDRMIAASIAGYTGSCPCPYSTDRAGRRCGGRSAWSRPGGASPLCFRSDITDEMVAAYRARRGL
jgi:hypothetical protein